MKKVVYTANAPEPVGPYSQAVMMGDSVYLSGQICIDATTGALQNESIESETKQVLNNLTQVLLAADCSVDDLIRTDIFMTDISNFAVVNELYDIWLQACIIKPSRQTVEVAKLPKNARIEISCIAYKSQGRHNEQIDNRGYKNS